MKEEQKTAEERIAISNRKARHDYEVLESFEVGIVLKGSEVKSLRLANANLQDSYAHVENGEVWLSGMYIGAYEQANIMNHEPRRERKLLLHRKEIRKIIGKTAEKGLTLVPLKVYFRDGRAKIQLAVCKGKRSYDKRAAIAKRETEREMRRQFTGREA